MSKFIIVIPAWRLSSSKETLVFAGFSHFPLKDARSLVFPSGVVWKTTPPLTYFADTPGIHIRKFLIQSW